MRRRGGAPAGPSKASSRGRAITTPAARRKSRLVMLMRVPLFGLEEPALDDLMDQRPEAVLLLGGRPHQGVDLRSIGPRGSAARRVGQQLFRQRARQAVRVGRQQLLVVVDVLELAAVEERV